MSSNGNGSATKTEFEPILFEIIEGAIESARREMEIQVERTARSSIVREQHDHRSGIFDAQGESVTALSFASVPTPIMKKFAGNINEGDIFIYNDPYKSDGGITHLGDMCITNPVFYKGEIIAYIQVFGHVNDIGGATPGSVPLAAYEIFQEGFIVPPVKLYDRGVRNEALYETILNNSRFIDDLQGDIDAFVNATFIGVARVEELCERYGTVALAETFEALLDRCARSLLETVLPMIPDGSYTFEDFCEYVDVQPRETLEYVKLRATMTKTPEGINFDFTGTDRQIKGTLNWPANDRYYAKTLGTLFLAFAPDMIINDGVNRVVTCTLPKGTVLSPEWPAACGWRTFPLLRILDVGLGILGKASGGFVPAPSESISSYGLFGDNEDGEFFLLREITGAGSGARPFADGADTVDVAPESKNMPAEFAETNYPVRIMRLGLREDSGGPGLYRGGLGYRKDIEILMDGELMIHSDRATLQPWGVKGGKAGQGSVWLLNPDTPEERTLPGKADSIPVVKGDVLRVLSPGGGGWGDPLDRVPSEVALDVKRRLVSRASANDDFGVVFLPTDDDYMLEADEPATEALREEMRASRPALKMFDRGPAFYRLVEEGKITLTSSDDEVELVG
jgi:N-methylhydantoinase B